MKKGECCGENVAGRPENHVYHRYLPLGRPTVDLPHVTPPSRLRQIPPLFTTAKIFELSEELAMRYQPS